MNSITPISDRVQIAQAGTPPSTAQPVKKVVVQRPADGQSVVIDVRGGAEIDLRSVANERVVFVQAGDRLIILFENREAVVLSGFYRDGQIAQDLVFDVGQQQAVSPLQFASLFPISSDLTILPAAGPASSSGSNGSAKNVSDPEFSSIVVGGRTGLGLLEGTETSDTTDPVGGAPNGVPTVAAVQATVLVDEDGLLPDGIEGGPDDVPGAPSIITGRLIYSFGSDGASPTAPISFDVSTLPQATSFGAPIT